MNGRQELPVHPDTQSPAWCVRKGTVDQAHISYCWRCGCLGWLASILRPRAWSRLRHQRGLSTKDADADEARDDHADERESDDDGHHVSTQKAMQFHFF